LTRCPELSLGLFTLPVLDDKPKPRATLVGHIIATRTSGPCVTDGSMKLPKNWSNERWTFEDGQAVGHEEGGGTIAIHSLAVLPEHQGKQVGSTLMKSYISRIREAQIADRIAIIAHDHLIPFYESFGFESHGPSKCQFGGGGWVDMVRTLYT
jgi:GNAT superfamily N-acetyltransferase